MTIHRIRNLRYENLESRDLLATFLVDSPADSGPGSLRWAINDANQTPETDLIEFNLPTGEQVIEPLSPLPWITEPVIIDATSQPGYVGEPLVELSGQRAILDSTSGFVIDGGGTRIEGFVIRDFPETGILIRNKDSNYIYNNYIGTDASGMVAAPNGLMGVHIVNSKWNVVGGLFEEHGNVISGNEFDGVRIDGESSGNWVSGNRIGTNKLGDAAVPNLRSGVIMINGANENFVGTRGDGLQDDQEWNLISGNTYGVRIYDAHRNTVAGNVIGLDQSRTESLPNRTGVLVDNQSRLNLIGSNGDGLSDPLERNLISGNKEYGVWIHDFASTNYVSGNFIGSDDAGLQPLPNAVGVYVASSSQRNVIGTLNGDYVGNLVSGNAHGGVWLNEAQFNTISGNLVGVNIQGTDALANGGAGVLLRERSSRNLIGTDGDGVFNSRERNVISGNQEQGVLFTGNLTQSNELAGNYIGTDRTGTFAVPNLGDGVALTDEASGNNVGVPPDALPDFSAGNLISGNAGDGVSIETSFNFVGGNTIGLASDGNSLLGNQKNGIHFKATRDVNHVGDDPQHENVIAGNGEWGIRIENSATVWASGNRVGISATGTPAGNLLGGILLEDSAHSLIGTSKPNIIAHNGPVGIALTGSDSIENRFNNSIFGHTLMGIDLGNDGPTANDSLDLDEGPNRLQNKPLISYTEGGNRLIVEGVYEGRPIDSVRIFLYASDEIGMAAQGRDYLGFVDIETDANGQASWSEVVREDLTGRVVTALAVRNGDTSEFADGQLILPPISLNGPHVVNEADGSFTATIPRPSGVPLAEELTVVMGDYQSGQFSVPATVTIQAGQPLALFEVTLVDDEIFEPTSSYEVSGVIAGIGAGKLRFLVEDDDGPPWHNQQRPNDVNDDSFVSSIDALLVINFLNNNADRDLSDRVPDNPPIYVDVNGDNFATAVDALRIINSLGSQGTGEGEAPTEGIPDLAEASWWFDDSWLLDLHEKRLHNGI